MRNMCVLATNNHIKQKWKLCAGVPFNSQLKTRQSSALTALKWERRKLTSWSKYYNNIITSSGLGVVGVWWNERRFGLRRTTDCRVVNIWQRAAKRVPAGQRTKNARWRQNNFSPFSLIYINHHMSRVFHHLWTIKKTFSVDLFTWKSCGADGKAPLEREWKDFIRNSRLDVLIKLTSTILFFSFAALVWYRARVPTSSIGSLARSTFWWWWDINFRQAELKEKLVTSNSSHRQMRESS